MRYLDFQSVRRYTQDPQSKDLKWLHDALICLLQSGHRKKTANSLPWLVTFVGISFRKHANSYDLSWFLCIWLGREREREGKGRGRRRVKEQPIVLVLVFHLVWGRVSCSQLCGTSPKNSPVSTSHLIIGMLGLQVLATTSIFYLGSRKSSYLCGKPFLHWAIVSLDHDDLSKDFLLRLPVCTAKPQAINKLDEAPPLTHTDLAKLQFPFYGAWNPGGIFQRPEHTITISSSLVGVSCERPQPQIHQLVQGFSDRFISDRKQIPFPRY